MKGEVRDICTAYRNLEEKGKLEGTSGKLKRGIRELKATLKGA